jgi:hypothetical protein
VAEETILQFLETPYQLEPPILRLISKQPLITSVKKKSPGYDLITSKILKELPIIGTKYLTQLFNAILLLNYFPTQWKIAQIFQILNPGNPPPPRSTLLTTNQSLAHCIQTV